MLASSDWELWQGCVVTLRNCSWVFFVTMSLMGDDRAVRKAVDTVVFFRDDVRVI